MADGFHIDVEGERAARLKAAAEGAGMTPAAFAMEALDRALDDDWSEDMEALAEYDRDGGIDAEEALATFEANVEVLLAARN